MSRTAVARTIDASVERVFDTVAHIENFSTAVPHIIDVEFLSEQRRGVGTRFRETRAFRGRQATTELEVTEYVKNELVRLVSDEGGTIWDTVFTVTGVEEGTRLDMVMDASAYKFTAKLLNPLLKGIIARAIKGDMDAVKAYCEGGQDDAQGGDDPDAGGDPNTRNGPGTGSD